ncbi:hypothetical protein SAMN04487970_10855 [Paenibacillus tianmuensis]|uniref:DUF2313 domain-containing protein n=1 Tax=Paenibacillus tianmuensis TaxID=624147 RepID=A0A1G4U085_9BACL|nr:putative phage tail protein [Paenibacillus tianmuensis]SCW87031.1 hypothetical protein SAMN04487970_10855 [Paenibacillus tianmuensis]
MKFFELFQRILPTSFLNGSNTRGLYEAIARQFDELRAAILEGQDQLFIDSATYMLPVYEAEFAIIRVDQSDIQGRRNNVMAMSRGGLGSTPVVILNALKSYGYSCELIEDYANYRVKILFTDARGVPSNINDLQQLMNRLIPGHLELQWKFIYTQHRELMPFTHQQMKGHTHEYYKTKLPS